MKRAPVSHRNGAKLERPVSLSVYLGSIILLTAVFTGGLLAIAYTDGWDGWPLAVIGLIVSPRRKSVGGHTGELACHVTGHATSSPPNGFFRWHSIRNANLCGRPDAAPERAQHRGTR